MVVDAILEVEFNAFILQYTNIYILSVDCLYDVVGFDSEEVDAILHTPLHESLFP